MVKWSAGAQEKRSRWRGGRLTAVFAMLLGLVGSVPFGMAQQRPRVVGPVDTAANGGSSVAPVVARHKFIVGEKLVYGVRVNVPSLGLRDAPVAKFSTEIVERGQFHGREGLRLVVRAETTGFVKATLFDLDDRFVTYLDPATRLPYRAEADIKEGGRVERTVTVFDQVKRTAQLSDGRLIRLKSDVYDLAGLLWTTRNLDFDGAAKTVLSALNDRNGAVIMVEIERLGRETLRVAGQEVPVVQLALRPVDATGKPSDERKIRLWITDDAQRYAVRITGGNEMGEFKAELSRFPNQSPVAE
ncbi:MAG: DUF3108 domain-containing protein [Chloracidobacterium sp.]|uniref:DUF3108 domain-containing protein n=1 Tax=Chloracidobacterium validum TaxID=2821543 RepID=A0ABX8BA34_9BACT|nr:DUF3108 domain-containing protein [Chloracidobacterium validum]QUW03272.1 DUF3108 domain-containing protein [Chloracidobacterium validum]